jgi:APA family basic amino acid/polyamine antiporter
LRKFKPVTIIAIVVANMVGTGVFTSLGFQVIDIQSGFALVMLWAVGGVAALCGALCYAEMGSALPRSGGEYNFLGHIYHPAAGFISGWISASVGFTAPVALASLTFAAYAAASVPALNSPGVQPAMSVALILILATVHGSSHRNSGGLQNFFTALKIAVILAFCTAVFVYSENAGNISLIPGAADLAALGSGAFAVSLIYVSYAYTGWNVATYLSGEMENPRKQLMPVLVIGTLIVTVLYVLVNYAFLLAVPVEDLKGKIEIGAIAAESVFGRTGGQISGAFLAFLLVSTVSAMTVAGPRVLQVIGEDYPALRQLGLVNRDGIPAKAIWVQSLVAVLFVLLADFQSIILFAGFTLALNSFATVAALIVFRLRSPEADRPYRVFAYPIPPVIYLMLTGWTLIYVLIQNPVEGAVGLGIVAAGGLLYLVTARSKK